MHRPLCRHTHNGFSYIEALIALSIVSICMVSLLGLHTAQLRAADYANRTRDALAIAQEKLSELSISPDSPAPGHQGTVTINNTEYKWHATIEKAALPEVAAEIRQNIRRITVIVAWPGGAGVELNTLTGEQRL